MLPDKEVVDGDVGELGLGSIGSQEAQPVLRGDDIVWVGGGLGQLQHIQELLELSWCQRVNVLPHHWSFSLVTVWSCPAKLTLATVKASKVTCAWEGIDFDYWGIPKSAMYNTLSSIISWYTQC